MQSCHWLYLADVAENFDFIDSGKEKMSHVLVLCVLSEGACQ